MAAAAAVAPRRRVRALPRSGRLGVRGRRPQRLARPRCAARPPDEKISTMDRKRALVTGAGSGIGAAVARRLAAGGATVTLGDVNAQAAEAVAAELGARAVALDVRDEAEVAAATNGVEILVNVAGIGSTTNAPDTTLEVWEDVFAVNARGTFLCCKHAIPGMAARGGGAIVNIASVAGLVGLRNRAAYCASKGAVIALTRALAVDHAADRIRVNAV